MSSHSVAPGDRSVPWRDVFPKACRLKPVKYVCSINARSLPETTDPDTEFRYVDISNVDSDGNWVSSEPMRFGDAPSRARRVVADGDVLVSTVRTYLRSIAHIDRVDEPLICSTGFAVLTANGAVGSKFLAYWARSVHFVDEVVARSVGVSYPAVNAPDLGNIPCPVLPIDEQRAIGRFLDRETARIDALIEKKRRQIELLHEKRAALISHAVTKGLDPAAPMKDSRTDWLGPIPAHWLMKRFRFDLTSVEQGWSPQCDNSLAEPHEWGVLKVGCVNGTEFDESEHKRLPDDLEPRTAYEIKPGDILMSRANTTELLGSAVLVRKVRHRLLLCDKLYRMRIDARSLDPEFVVYAFGSNATRYQFERDATGASASMKNIGQDTIKGLLMPRPPVDEQRDIVRVLNAHCERVHQVVAKVRASIERLREYRAALISAAVTGKIDVREAIA